MTVSSQPDTSRRILLRLVVKVMLWSLVVGLIVVMSRPFLGSNKKDSREQLRIKVNQLEVGASQGLEWQRQRWLVIRPGEEIRYIVILDYDPFYGCPLQWIKPGDLGAPRQPWPGGLRATCTDHWFDPQGHSLNPDIADLKLLPYQLEGTDTLVLGSPSQ